MTDNAEVKPPLAGSSSVAPSGGIATVGLTVTIRDVARQAAVSPATVSRVLTGSAVVTPTVRTRVLTAISDLGYRPNQVARNLRQQKAAMIGLVIGDIENSFFTEMVRAVEDAAFELGYRVLLCNTDENADKQSAYLGVMVAERVLGVILTPSSPDAREIGELLDLGIPLVAFDRTIGDPRADSVTTNNEEAARLATQYLLDYGYRRIALISSTEIQTGLQRLAGYEQAMRSAGLRPQSAPGFSRVEGGRTATEQLMWGPDPPEALIAGNGLTCIGALKALQAGRFSVPKDVALVMIDDPFWAELVHPPVTALAQPIKAMAQAMVDLLVDRLKTGRVAAQHRVFEFELKVRASSRCQ